MIHLFKQSRVYPHQIPLTPRLSQVYLAQHKYTGKQVAIKVMSQSRISRYLDLNGQRVPAEIALIANLNHSSIIQVIALVWIYTITMWNNFLDW